MCSSDLYYLDVFHDQAHIGKDYYIHVFIEQVGVIYLNLVKVCLGYDTCRDLGEDMKHKVQWDPGGASRWQLEGRPPFKEGGMLATYPYHYWAGLGLLGRHGGSDYKYRWKRYEQAGLELDDFGLHNFGLLLPPLFLFL